MLRHFNTLCIGEINVEPAVAIVVDKRYATAHRLHNKFLLRTRIVLEMDSGRRSYVDEFGIFARNSLGMLYGGRLNT